MGMGMDMEMDMDTEMDTKMDMYTDEKLFMPESECSDIVFIPSLNRLKCQ
jgi:hypothetical protein